jgi:hypothetical protein
MCAGRLNSTTCGYTHGDAHIEYRKHVSMIPHLIMAPGFVSHIENYEPRLARWLRKLGGICRTVLFDKRGIEAKRPHATSRPILSKITEVIDLLLLSAPDDSHGSSTFQRNQSAARWPQLCPSRHLMPDGSPQSVPVWVGREEDHVLICTGKARSRQRTFDAIRVSRSPSLIFTTPTRKSSFVAEWSSAGCQLGRDLPRRFAGHLDQDRPQLLGAGLCSRAGARVSAPYRPSRVPWALAAVPLDYLVTEVGEAVRRQVNHAMMRDWDMGRRCRRGRQDSQVIVVDRLCASVKHQGHLVLLSKSAAHTSLQQTKPWDTQQIA